MSIAIPGAQQQNLSAFIAGKGFSDLLSVGNPVRVQLSLKQPKGPTTACVTAADFDDYSLVFGGGLYPSDALMRYEEDEFTKPDITLSNRTLHALCRYKDSVVMHGGTKAPVREFNEALIDPGVLTCVDAVTSDVEKLELHGSLPTARVGHRLIQVDDEHLMLCGGISGTCETLSDVYIISMRTLACRRATNMPFPLANFVLVEVNGRFIALTGSCSTSTLNNKVLEFRFFSQARTDAGLGTWSTLGSLPVEVPLRKSAGAVGYYNYLIVGFGWDGHKAVLDDLWAFDVSQNTWSMLQVCGGKIPKRYAPVFLLPGGILRRPANAALTPLTTGDPVGQAGQAGQSGKHIAGGPSDAAKPATGQLGQIKTLSLANKVVHGPTTSQPDASPAGCEDSTRINNLKSKLFLTKPDLADTLVISGGIFNTSIKTDSYQVVLQGLIDPKAQPPEADLNRRKSFSGGFSSRRMSLASSPREPKSPKSPRLPKSPRFGQSPKVPKSPRLRSQPQSPQLDNLQPRSSERGGTRMKRPDFNEMFKNNSVYEAPEALYDSTKPTTASASSARTDDGFKKLPANIAVRSGAPAGR